jgi:hypothetical protein
VFDWLRRLFSSGGREAEAAEREEYGLAPRDDLEQPGEYKSFAGAEGVQAAEDELGEFEAPSDPAP